MKSSKKFEKGVLLFAGLLVLLHFYLLFELLY